MFDWCFSQSQLSACSKALESSEELLELANQTLCSRETDGFTQVSDRLTLLLSLLLHCPPPRSLFVTEYLMISGEFHCGVILPVILTQIPATLFVLNDNMMGSNSVLSSLHISLLFPFPLCFSSPGGQRH